MINCIARFIINIIIGFFIITGTKDEIKWLTDIIYKKLNNKIKYNILKDFVAISVCIIFLIFINLPIYLNIS